MPSTLDRAFLSPDAKRDHVRRLFGTIADRYDLITRLLSGGRDQQWKRRLVEEGGIRPGDRVLDLACGTGDLAALSVQRGAQVTGLDLTVRMIELARRKSALRAVAWIVGDMTRLPLPDRCCDVVTTGYGLRNVPDLPRALAEIHRVLRAGGRLCSLDFDRPESPACRAVYLAYLEVVGAALGWALHRDPDTYRYIPASIRRWPGARGVADLMRQQGFEAVRHVPLLAGFMAIHVARKAG
jgi:ubiquinone/menaquinone biosynthesis methyltransferase